MSKGVAWRTFGERYEKEHERIFGGGKKHAEQKSAEAVGRAGKDHSVPKVRVPRKVS